MKKEAIDHKLLSEKYFPPPTTGSVLNLFRHLHKKVGHLTWPPLASFIHSRQLTVVKPGTLTPAAQCHTSLRPLFLV